MRNQVEKERQDYLLKINLAESLKRLYSNPDFVLLFKKHYSESYVLDLVSNLALYDNNSVEYQEVIKELNVISNFNAFLDRTLNNGAMAELALQELTVIPDNEIDEYE